MPKSSQLDPNAAYLQYGRMLYNRLLPNPAVGVVLQEVFLDALVKNPKLKNPTTVWKELKEHYAGFLEKRTDDRRTDRIYLLQGVDITDFESEIQRSESEARKVEGGLGRSAKK